MSAGKGRASTSSRFVATFPIPEWKWEFISMDFITGFPMTWRQHDSIMVVVEKLTKESHFIPRKFTYKVDSIAKKIMK